MAQGKTDHLEAFAKRIMTRLKAGGATDSLERIICRHLTGENEKVSAFMADKVVGWRFGKPKETHEHQHRVELSVGDADRIIAGYFIAAAGGPHQAGQSDTGQAEKQTLNVLPASRPA